MNEQRWKGWMQLVFGLGLTFLFFYMMAPFVVAILLGAVISIVCYPLFENLRRFLPAWLSAAFVTLSVTIGVLFPVIFILINAAYKLLALVGKMKLPREGGVEALLNAPFLAKGIFWLERFTPLDREWLQEQAPQVFHTILENMSRAIGGFLAGLPGLLLAFSVVIISVYFFLVDGARFLRFLSSLSPMKSERSLELYSTFEKSCRGVVLGLFLSAVIQGVLIGTLFLITGIPNVFLMAVLGVIMGMVPVVGTAPLTVGAILYLFSTGRPGMGIVMIVGAVITATADNVIRPLVMKGQSEMHPLLALVSAFGATNLMGPTGIFLGPIIAGVFVSFLRIVALEIRRENILQAAAVETAKV